VCHQNNKIRMPEQPDAYGQIHPVETPELLKQGLKDLDEEIEKIPKDSRINFETAKLKCANLTNDDAKLVFLRCEVFNADLAAIRLLKYWDKRVELFGEDKAFLPLTLDGALKDDMIALSCGYIRLLPNVKDPSGRAVFMVDPALQQPSKYERVSLVRSIWYVTHAALESVTAQQKGVVFLVYPHNISKKIFDQVQLKMNMESLKGLLPLRVAAVHICKPTFIFSSVFSVVKVLMGERLRKRIKKHSGKDEHVLKRLADFGLTKDMLPSEFGGKLALDHASWLKTRRSNGL